MLEANPWIARSLLRAFEASLAISKQDRQYRSSLKVVLLSLADRLDQTVAALGKNSWAYRIGANRYVLEPFLRYSFDHELVALQYAPEEIFAASTVATFR